MAYPVGSPYSGSTPSPAYAGIFIPALWSGKLVEKFYDATVLAAISNTDYEGEIKNQGDTVKIRTRPSITIADYQADQALTIQRPSSNLVELTIDKGKYFNLALDDVMEVQSDLDLLSLWAEDAAEQMKIAVDTDVLTALGTTSDISVYNRGNTAGKISGNIRLGTPGAPCFIQKTSAGTGDGSSNSNDKSVLDFIVDAGQVLDEQNVPETGRWMVIPAWMASMIKKSDLKDASLAGDGTSILRNGRLGMIDRFTLYHSNLLPASGGSYSEEKAVFFGTSAALTFASQFTKMETLRSESSFSTLVRGLQVYGYKVVNGVAIGRAIVEAG
jgi:N4-gp56 family major capsid protein